MRANTDILLQGFLKAVIDSTAFQRKIADITKGVALKGININEFKVCPIILPPLDLQQKWIEFSQQIDKSKYSIIKCLIQMQNLPARSVVDLAGRLYEFYARLLR